LLSHDEIHFLQLNKKQFLLPATYKDVVYRQSIHPWMTSKFLKGKQIKLILYFCSASTTTHSKRTNEVTITPVVGVETTNLI